MSSAGRRSSGSTFSAENLSAARTCCSCWNGSGPNRMRFCIYSNGVLITREQAGYLGRSGRCDRVQLSIDGFEATHDSVRGRGMWKKALGREPLCCTGTAFPSRSNVTVGAFNSAEAVGLAHFLNRQEYIDRIIFSRVSAVGREWPERLRPLTIPETARLIPAVRAGSERAAQGPPRFFRLPLPE